MSKSTGFIVSIQLTNVLKHSGLEALDFCRHWQLTESLHTPCSCPSLATAVEVEVDEAFARQFFAGDKIEQNLFVDLDFLRPGELSLHPGAYSNPVLGINPSISHDRVREIFAAKVTADRAKIAAEKSALKVVKFGNRLPPLRTTSEIFSTRISYRTDFKWCQAKSGGWHGWINDGNGDNQYLGKFGDYESLRKLISRSSTAEQTEILVDLADTVTMPDGE